MSVDGMELGGQTITVRRPNPVGTFDEFGNPVQGAPIIFTISNCALQPLVARNVTSEELVPTRDSITTHFRLFAPYGSDLKNTDEVLNGDEVLAVSGDVMTWDPDEFGDGHCEAYLERKAG